MRNLCLLFVLASWCFSELKAQRYAVSPYHIDRTLNERDSVFTNDTISITTFDVRKKKSVIQKESVVIYSDGYVSRRKGRMEKGAWTETVYTRDSAHRVIKTESYSEAGALDSRVEYFYSEDTITTVSSDFTKTYRSVFVMDSAGNITETIRYRNGTCISWQRQTWHTVEWNRVGYYLSCNVNGTVTDTLSRTIIAIKDGSVYAEHYSDSGAIEVLYTAVCDSMGRVSESVTTILIPDSKYEPAGEYITHYTYYPQCSDHLKKIERQNSGPGIKGTIRTYTIWRHCSWPADSEPKR